MDVSSAGSRSDWPISSEKDISGEAAIDDGVKFFELCMGKLAVILVDAHEMLVEDLGPGEIQPALLALDALPDFAAPGSGFLGFLYFGRPRPSETGVGRQGGHSLHFASVTGGASLPGSGHAERGA